MKLTNCYRYMAVLYTASCGAASPLYGPLETGLQESQLLNSLKTCKSLEGPETDAYLSRTGLNGAYKTKKPIGGLFFSLHFEYGKDGGLKAVSFYSTTKAGKEEYDTRLKSLYKRMLNGLTGLYGPPMNLPDWIEKESLPAERVLYMHMWRLQPGCFLMAGLANMGASGYIPVFRISPPSGMPPKSRKDRNKLKSEWAAIPEFTNSSKRNASWPMRYSPCPIKNTRTRCSSSKKRQIWAAPTDTGDWPTCTGWDPPEWEKTCAWRMNTPENPPCRDLRGLP